MSKIKSTLGYLGQSFQLQLLNQLIVDEKFSTTIIDILDPTYFDSEHLRFISNEIKNYWEKYQTIPLISTLEQIVNQIVTKEITRDYVLDSLQEIKNVNQKDCMYVQDTALKFCKQQELKKATKKIDKILESGDFEKYDDCVEILKKAVSVGNHKDSGTEVFEGLDDVLSDDFRKPIPTGIVGLDNLMDGGLSKGELGVILAPFGVGKEQPLSSKILTPNGWVTMGEIKIGDDVIDMNGNPQKVLGVFPQGEKDIYTVKFNDGTETKCGLEHLWAVNSKNQRTRTTHKNNKIVRLPSDNIFKVLSTKDLMFTLKKHNNRFLNYKIPLVKPIKFEDKDLPIDPYILGLLLGDGYMKRNSIITKDIEIYEHILKFIDPSKTKIITRLRKRNIDNGGEMILTTTELYEIKFYKIIDHLIDLNLHEKKSIDKFIPKIYKFNSIKNRIKLLQGLMDTDGYTDKRGRCQFSSISKELISDVKELVLSLGGYCGEIKSKSSHYKKDGVKIYCNTSYTITISFPSELNINPFSLKRKSERVISRDKYDKFIKTITYSHREAAQCIYVSSPEHLYVTDDYILTHNTTMITKIATTAYLMGNNVVQIFFEDNPKVIKRKHYTCWSGVDLSNLSKEKEKVKEIVDKIKNERENHLILKKFPSDSTTIPHVEQYLRKLISDGIRPDIVLLDYIDCIVPTRHFNDEYASEGPIMRQFESMISELDIVGWTAIQGNRSSIGADVVDSNMIGGSIKKGQIGHFIVSIAKNLQQKEEGTATMAILKSRFGKDGMVFENILFDNGKILIDTTQTSNTSILDMGKFNDKSKQDRVNKAIKNIENKNTLKNKIY